MLAHCNLKQHMCFSSKYSSLFSFNALPSTGKSKDAVVHWQKSIIGLAWGGNSNAHLVLFLVFKIARCAPRAIFVVRSFLRSNDTDGIGLSAENFMHITVHHKEITFGVPFR